MTAKSLYLSRICRHILRTCAAKIYQKAAAAPLGFSQNKPNCGIAVPINSPAIGFVTT